MPTTVTRRRRWGWVFCGGGDPQPNISQTEEMSQRCTSTSYVDAVEYLHSTPSSHASTPATPSSRQRSETGQEANIDQLVSYLTLGNSRLKAIASQGLAHAISKENQLQSRVVQVLACADIISTLVSMLQGSNEQGKVHAANLLQSTMADSTTVVDLPVVVSALVDAARNSSTIAARKAALRVLGRLVRQKEAVQALVECEGVEALVEILSTHTDGSTLKACLHAMYYAGADRSHIQTLLANTGAVPLLLRLCHCAEMRVVQHAAQVLRMLAKARVCCEQISAAGGLATLVSLSATSQDTDTRSAAQVALQRIELVSRLKHDLPPPVIQGSASLPEGMKTEAPEMGRMSSSPTPITLSEALSTCLALDAAPPMNLRFSHPLPAGHNFGRHGSLATTGLGTLPNVGACLSQTTKETVVGPSQSLKVPSDSSPHCVQASARLVPPSSVEGEASLGLDGTQGGSLHSRLDKYGNDCAAPGVLTSCDGNLKSSSAQPRSGLKVNVKSGLSSPAAARLRQPSGSVAQAKSGRLGLASNSMPVPESPTGPIARDSSPGTDGGGTPQLPLPPPMAMHSFDTASEEFRSMFQQFPTLKHRSAPPRALFPSTLYHGAPSDQPRSMAMPPSMPPAASTSKHDQSYLSATSQAVELVSSLGGSKSMMADADAPGSDHSCVFNLSLGACLQPVESRSLTSKKTSQKPCPGQVSITPALPPNAACTPGANLGGGQPLESRLESAASVNIVHQYRPGDMGVPLWPMDLDLVASMAMGSPTVSTLLTSCQTAADAASPPAPFAHDHSLGGHTAPRQAAKQPGVKTNAQPEHGQSVFASVAAAAHLAPVTDGFSHNAAGISAASETSFAGIGFPGMRSFHSLPPSRPHHQPVSMLPVEVSHSAMHLEQLHARSSFGNSTPQSPISSVESIQVVRKLLDTSVSTASSISASALRPSPQAAQPTGSVHVSPQPAASSRAHMFKEDCSQECNTSQFKVDPTKHSSPSLVEAANQAAHKRTAPRRLAQVVAAVSQQWSPASAHMKPATGKTPTLSNADSVASACIACTENSCHGSASVQRPSMLSCGLSASVASECSASAGRFGATSVRAPSPIANTQMLNMTATSRRSATGSFSSTGAVDLEDDACSSGLMAVSRMANDTMKQQPCRQCARSRSPLPVCAAVPKSGSSICAPHHRATSLPPPSPAAEHDMSSTVRRQPTPTPSECSRGGESSGMPAYMRPTAAAVARCKARDVHNGSFTAMGQHNASSTPTPLDPPSHQLGPSSMASDMHTHGTSCSMVTAAPSLTALSRRGQRRGSSSFKREGPTSSAGSGQRPSSSNQRSAAPSSRYCTPSRLGERSGCGGGGNAAGATHPHRTPSSSLARQSTQGGSRANVKGPKLLGRASSSNRTHGSCALVDEGSMLKGHASPVVCPSPVRDSVESLQEVLESASGRLGDFLLRPDDIVICTDADGCKVVLGEGGFGVVYKGVMNGVDEVAVKVAKKEGLSKVELESFLREVSLLARLHHRNIVQAYGVCLVPRAVCLVTELLRGGDMYHALRVHPHLMAWNVLGRKVALDIALGLNHLHCQSPPLMHRDLKSPNVLLSEEGVAKVADVGMSRAQVSDTVSAQPIMTPLWAAPEVVAKQPASIKADMWSYGVLIWELASGADITSYSPLAVSRTMNLKGPKVLTMAPDAPPVAQKIFDACTAIEPSERPSASTVVAWLREAESQGGASASGGAPLMGA